MSRSELEETFLGTWKMFSLSEMFLFCLEDPEEEYCFDVFRKWRFDFAWPEQMVAVECEGGVHTQGRHTRGVGFEGDCEKYNKATFLGWKVFRVTAGMLKKDPFSILNQLAMSLR